MHGLVLLPRGNCGVGYLLFVALDVLACFIGVVFALWLGCCYVGLLFLCVLVLISGGCFVFYEWCACSGGVALRKHCCSGGFGLCLYLETCWGFGFVRWVGCIWVWIDSGCVFSLDFECDLLDCLLWVC